MYLNYQRIFPIPTKLYLHRRGLLQEWGSKQPCKFVPASRNSALERVSPVSDLVVLICAVLASLTSGVLIAYGVCLAFFQLLPSRVRAVSAARPDVVSVPAAVEG